MSTRTVLSVGLLAVACGSVSSQPQPLSRPLPALPPGGIHAPPSGNVPLPLPQVPQVPPPPPEKTVEEVLNELERVQTQKAELEKKEQELKATVRKKLEQQTERLNKLGVTPAPAKPALPDRVGRIIIEGNTNTPDKMILDSLVLSPGQILQHPALEKARAKLEKAGFRSVVVEVIPNDLDDVVFKDIRIRIEEPEPKPAVPLPAPELPK